jgi:D-alanine--poly(phosphoribitol) ligase subunit 1
MVRHVWQYVERASELFPHKIAFADDNTRCTFAEFRESCERLALRIAQHQSSGCEPGREAVAVFLEKNIHALTAFFACAATGNFYSPLDVQTPENRLRTIMDSLQPRVVVTHSRWRDLIVSVAPTAQIECVDSDCDAKRHDTCVDFSIIRNIASKIVDTDLLYVIFTSGSTGRPKGVCVSHRAVIDYAEWASTTFGLDENVRQGNLGPFSFDISVHDIFCTVRNGSFLYLISDAAIRFPKCVIDVLNRNRIDSLFWVPSALVHIACSKILATSPPEYLKRVMFCGEVMPVKHLTTWQSALPDVTYVNLYGPTEATEACTFYVVNRVFTQEESLPIGRACANTDIIVVDENGGRIGENDAGAVGELCIRGSCLGFGYYNDMARTRESFVQNPLHNRHPDVVYRTGDLVKYNTNGELLFVGRNDTQVKRLGYRIELGEIDVAALAYRGVEQACALYQKETNDIVLFVQGNGIERHEFETALRASLPKYMWPTRLEFLQEMPLNANGKYDRQELARQLRS